MTKKVLGLGLALVATLGVACSDDTTSGGGVMVGPAPAPSMASGRADGMSPVAVASSDGKTAINLDMANAAKLTMAFGGPVTVSVAANDPTALPAGTTEPANAAGFGVFKATRAARVAAPGKDVREGTLTGLAFSLTYPAASCTGGTLTSVASGGATCTTVGTNPITATCTFSGDSSVAMAGIVSTVVCTASSGSTGM